MSKDQTSLQGKIDFLRSELLGLITQDNELFKQLLTLNDTIEELKESNRNQVEHVEHEEEQQEQFQVGRGLPSTLNQWDEEEEEDEEDGNTVADEEEINNLIDEALDLDLDDDDDDDEGHGSSLSKSKSSTLSSFANNLRSSNASPSPIITQKRSFLPISNMRWRSALNI